MGAGNFARLKADLLVRKGEAEPSPVMATFPFAQRVAPGPVDAPVPAGPRRHSERRELLDPSTIPDKPRRMVMQLSTKEYELLGLVAVKKGTTPQYLLRTALHEFLADIVEQYNGSCQCIGSGCCDQAGEANQPKDELAQQTLALVAPAKPRAT